MTPGSHLLLFLVAVAGDLAIGDPQVRWHPVRLLGCFSRWLETGIRQCGGHGHLGGLTHLLLMCAVPGALWWGGHRGLAQLDPWAAFAWDACWSVSLICTRDLLGHALAVARHLDDLSAARIAVGRLCGRDVDAMDRPACARATVESLGENLVDGVLTPLAAFALLGVPGLILVKVVSTLDSMIGYRDPRHRHFGMWAARLDDALNFVPARLAPLVLAVAGAPFGANPARCLAAAWRWHALLPSPNSGWGEAALAGCLRARLLGPIRAGGETVNEAWLGEPAWPAEADAGTIRRAVGIVATAALLWTTAAALAVWAWPPHPWWR